MVNSGLTKPGGFRGKDNKSPRCLHYAEGAEIDGDIAETAVREKWALPIKEKPAAKPDATAAKVDVRAEKPGPDATALP